MADSSAPEPLTPDQRATLLHLARRAIEHGLRTGHPPPVNLDELDQPLRRTAAAFVTLHVAGELHGCIGTLEAQRPLAAEVVRCAFAAAFEDPRFGPLQRQHLDDLDLHIALLAPATPLTFTDENHLLAQLRPGVDGLILRHPDTGRHATFLPAVWHKLHHPAQFLHHLRLKAGIPDPVPTTALQASRYTVEDIGTL